MIIHRVTAIAKPGKVGELVQLMGNEGRALFSVSRIGVIINSDEIEENGEHDGAIVFDLDFQDRAALETWRANVGMPDNKHLFDAFGEMIVDYSAVDLETQD